MVPYTEKNIMMPSARLRVTPSDWLL